MKHSSHAALRSTLLAVGLFAACASVCAEQASAIAPVRRIYDGKVAPDLQANTLRNSHRLFPYRVIKRGGKVRELPPHPSQLEDVAFRSARRDYDLFDYMSQNRVSGLLVLKGGKIVLERYALGNTPKTRWASMSIAKSISATLVGIALQEGRIRSLDDSLIVYLPELRGGAYDDVTVRQLIQMSSGVAWDETYTNPASNRRQVMELQIDQRPGSILQFMSGLPKAGPPGTLWKYSTGETYVVGALIAAATEQNVSSYLSKTIWSKAGMESDATWWLDAPNGAEVSGSGLSARLRDFGRFGLFVQEDGVVGSRQQLPPGWRDEAGSPKTISGKQVNYGYMWWTYPASVGSAHEGAFYAVGIFGQYLYINPRENLVIVVWSARSKPTGATVIQDADFFAGVVAALK